MPHMDAEQENFAQIPAAHVDAVLRAIRYEVQASRQFRLEGYHDEANALRDGNHEKVADERAERELLLARMSALTEVAAALTPASSKGLGHWATTALIALDQVPGPATQRLVQAVLRHVAAPDPFE